MITDQLCLDADDDLCLEDFDFLGAETLQYDKTIELKMGGVIPFNRYDAENNHLQSQ